jgi:prephenate dehydrogenase
MGAERTEPPFGKVVIIGVGLIGGSLGMALRERRLAGEVIGVVRREATIAEAIACGAVDGGTCDLDPAARGADLVVIATPLRMTRRWCESLAPIIDSNAIVTDVGSTKAEVVRDAEGSLPHPAMFVGGHPIAGSEQKGVAHAQPDLFEGAVYVLTPSERTDPGALDRMESLARAIGSQVVLMDADSHDRLLALTSHLPHVVASCLATAVGEITRGSQMAGRLVGSGLRDTTRVASGPTDVWADVLLTNRQEVLGALALHLDVVGGLVDALKAGDAEAVAEILARGKAARDSWNL